MYVLNAAATATVNFGLGGATAVVPTVLPSLTILSSSLHHSPLLELVWFENGLLVDPHGYFKVEPSMLNGWCNACNDWLELPPMSNMLVELEGLAKVEILVEERGF